MHLRIASRFLSGIAIPFLFLAAAPAGAEVLLNEVLADPASDWDGSGAYHSRDDEWVEIVNTGPGTVDLSEYRLAAMDTTWRYAFTGMLGAGQIRVVFGSDAYAWEQATGNPAYGLRLANGGGEIALFRVTDTDTVLVDCYLYVDHEAEDDRSSGRVPDGATEWWLFDSLNPYDGGTEPTGSACVPTPGLTINCPTPVESSTWGRVKRTFAR